jgi:small subunit ribosomal protein S16
MLMIRFQRVGKKNEPSFRVVLAEKYRGPRRKYLEELGFYNPRKKTVQLKSERILHWLSKGAQASPSCHNLFVREGVISGSKIKKGKIAVPSAAAEAEPAREPKEPESAEPLT